MIVKHRVPRSFDADEAPVWIVEAPVLETQHLLRRRPYQEEQRVPSTNAIRKYASRENNLTTKNKQLNRVQRSNITQQKPTRREIYLKKKNENMTLSRMYPFDMHGEVNWPDIESNIRVGEFAPLFAVFQCIFGGEIDRRDLLCSSVVATPTHQPE